MKIKLTFERCGRTGVTPTGTEVIADLVGLDEDSDEQDVLDAVAGAVHKFAKKRLASKWFDVTADSVGGFSIEAGRFGEGTWERMP